MAENEPPQDLSAPSHEHGLAWLGMGIAAAVILSGFLMALQPIRSADVWHHVKSGWLVRQNHGPARADVFSCTAQGRRWIQYEWLAQLLIYSAHESGGTAGLLFFRAVGVAIAAALLLMACRGRSVGWAASGAAVTFALCGASGRFFSRPEIFTMILLAGLMACFERLRRGRHGFWFLPALLMIPWVNMHGAWVAGLAYMGLMCGGDTIPHLLKRDSAKPKRTVAFLWLAMGLAVAATLVNPYGAQIWEVPFKLSNTAVVREAISEWQRPDAAHWLQPRFIGAWLFLLVLIRGIKWITPANALVVIFFGILALTARRHMALAMLVTAPIFAQQIALLHRRDCFGRLVRKKLASPARRAALVVILCVTLVVIALGGIGLPRAGLGLQKNRYPINAGRFLKTYKLEGNLFNSYAFGNYLLFARYPQNYVFIDGRVDMYGAEAVNLYERVGRAEAGWRDVLQEHSIEICVVETTRLPDAALLAALHQARDWALVYWDDISAIYVQRTPGHAGFLKQAYVYAVPPDSPNPDMIRTPAGPARAEKDYQNKLEEDPDCVLALWGKAECLRRRGVMDEAINAFIKAAELAPQLEALNFNLGACLLETGQLAEAERYLRHTLHLLKQDNGKNSQLRMMALWNLSLLYENRNNLKQAVAVMEEAVQAVPNNQRAAARLHALRKKAAGTGRQP